MGIKGTFGTAINCIDGRVQTPISNWVKTNARVKYVDAITRPGADRILANKDSDEIWAIYQTVKFSVERHQSNIIVISGHHDCAAYSVSFEEHKVTIAASANLIESWGLGVRVCGLYVNEWDAVDLVYGEYSRPEPEKSYL